MAIDEHVSASILAASTKSIGEKAYGNMILGVEDDDMVVAKAKKYLTKDPDITVQEVSDDA